METKQKKEASTTVESPASSDEKRSPVKSFREGDVSASIFARTHRVRGEDRTFYGVSFTRSYKTASGRFQYTKNFNAEDLEKVATVSQQAAEYIHSLQYPEVQK